MVPQHPDELKFQHKRSELILLAIASRIIRHKGLVPIRSSETSRYPGIFLV